MQQRERTRKGKKPEIARPKPGWAEGFVIKARKSFQLLKRSDGKDV
jgi:hypothetical protein